MFSLELLVRCYWMGSVPLGCFHTESLCQQGLANDDHDKSESVETQRQLLLIGRCFMDKKMPADQRVISRCNRNKNLNECSLVSNDAFKNDFCSEEDSRIAVVRNVNRKIPTPWPINIIQERLNNRLESSSQITTENKDTVTLNDHGTRRSSSYPSMGAIFFAYAKQQARIGFRQVSEISAQLWYNLPPSAPPLIFLASIPRNVKVLEGRSIVGAASTDSLRRIIPIFSDPFARSIVLAGMGMAVVSWSNQELQRKRKLTPLALRAMSNDQGVKGGGRVSRVFLPPFLPEDVPEPEIDALLGTMVENSELGDADSDELAANAFEESVLSHVSPKIRRHLSGIYETTTTTSKRFFRNYYYDWVQGRAVRKREVAKIRRNRIFDELVALQALKKRQAASRKKSETNTSASADSAASELGYALVTGASRGIGRAIAVELARWEIPMVLVARDVARLAQLASELEACYGVKCCILEADLSKANAAEKIHQATTQADISVDILINNAGVASEGLAIDARTSFVESMIMLNSVTYAKLSVLYGQDMKIKRRGRILMMSSMAGLCNASPNTAIYGACKAFGKSLALSMAKEMETYGVGVTCLIPGAVSDTDFRASSGTRKALCWYLPFYSRSPEIVAHQVSHKLLKWKEFVS
jgi:short-subunit dehydrogenase